MCNVKGQNVRYGFIRIKDLGVIPFDDFNSLSKYSIILYRVAPQKRNSQLSGLCSHQQLSFFTLLDRASFSHYNNTKIIKFGSELFIL